MNTFRSQKSPRHEERHDLALTNRQNLVAAGVAVEDEVNVAGDVALPGSDPSAPALSHMRDERPQYGTVGVGEFLEALKLADQCILHWITARRAICHPMSYTGRKLLVIRRHSHPLPDGELKPR